MRKFVNCYFLLLITLSALVFTACNDDDNYSGPSPDKVTARYSNKLAPGLNTLPLELTYSGREFYGNEVYFDTSDGVTGTLSLFGVFAGEQQTDITGVALSGSGDKYSFSGNGTSNKGTTFKYDGEVTEKGLSLNLTEVQVVANELSQQGQYDLVPYSSDVTIVMDENFVTTMVYNYSAFFKATSQITEVNNAFVTLNGVANSMLSRLLNVIIKDIHFMPDGNITATYAKFPEEISIQDIIMGNVVYTPAETDWVASPHNLAFYYIEDNNVYVVPSLEMIILQVQKDARADNGLDLAAILKLLQSISGLYDKITDWVSTGVQLKFSNEIEVEELMAGFIYQTFAGDCRIFIDKSELESLLPLLPLLKNYLPDTIYDLPLIGEMIDDLLDNLAYSTEKLELGLFLYKH